MKILLTGGSGLFGQAFVSLLENTDFALTATYYRHPRSGPEYIPLDVTNKQKAHKLMFELKPDIVVHAAAYTGVDDCEKHEQKAFDINVKGTENIAQIAQEIDAKFVYISTDYVFDGKKGLYKETDKTRPINYYGETKLKAEQCVKNICKNFVIARPSVIYGAEKQNFATWAINQLDRKKPINIVTDQWVSPTLNIDLAEQILALIEKDENGVFHTAGGERINRFDFTRELADIFGFDASLVCPTTMTQMDWIAERPRDSSLDISKISNIKKPLKIEESLARLTEELQ